MPARVNTATGTASQASGSRATVRASQVQHAAGQAVHAINLTLPPWTDVVVTARRQAPSMPRRALYFIVAGLWLGLLWTIAAWLLMVSLVGLPLGLLMLERLPAMMTLAPRRAQTRLTVRNGVLYVDGPARQRRLLARALYFLLIGWWASAVWLIVAWLLCAVVLGLPLAHWMFRRAPTVATLQRQ